MDKNIIWTKVEELATKNMAGLVFNSELNFDFQVHKIAEDLYSKASINIVLVAGPSASGKTTFTCLLKDRMEFLGVKTHVLALDDFFIDRDKIKILPSGVSDFDSINALDLKHLNNTLRSIFKGRTVTLPKFDFLSGIRIKGDKNIEMHDKDLLIIEGIHALNPLILNSKALEEKALRVFIAPARSIIMDSGEVLEPNDLRLIRRIIRDYYTRGHSLKKTLMQWSEVLQAEQKYIYPHYDKANYYVDSVYDYELIIYKSCLYDKIKEEKMEGLKKVKTILGEVKDFNLPTIPKTSLLNEFAIFS